MSGTATTPNPSQRPPSDRLRACIAVADAALRLLLTAARLYDALREAGFI